VFNHKIIAFAVSVAVTLGFIYVLLTDQVITDLRVLLPQVDPPYVIAAFCVGPVVQYLRAWRFSHLIHGAGLPTFPLYRIATYLVFFNYLLPFRTGELSFPLMVKRTLNVNFVTGLGILLISRAIDFIFLIGVGALVAMVILDPGFGVQSLSRMVLAIAVIFVVTAPFLSNIVKGRFLKFMERWRSIYDKILQLAQALEQINTAKSYFHFLGLTLLIWMLQFLLSFFCLRAVVPEVGILPAILAGVAAMLALSLPINGVAGIGPIHAVWALTLRATDIDWSAGIASAVVFHVVAVAGAAILTGVVTFVPYGYAFARQLWRRLDR